MVEKEIDGACKRCKRILVRDGRVCWREMIEVKSVRDGRREW